MAAMKSTRRRRLQRIRYLDLPAILGRFADALSLVETAHRAIEAANVRALGAEESPLRQGVACLQRSYSEIDLAFLRMRNAP